MTSDSIVVVEHVSKRFTVNVDRSLKERLVGLRHHTSRSSAFWALSDISLDVEPGITMGLVGHNGSGKSTLLKAIGGIIEPTTGRVQRRGRLAALLELGAGFHPDLTGRENVWLNATLLGLANSEISKHFDAIVDFSGIEDFIDTQVKFYSSGMYVRLAFAIAVHADPDLLLVDEVLAVGDEPFQRKCMDKISEFQFDGRTIILVSHSAEQVGRLCSRVAVLDKGHLAFDGGPEEGLLELRRLYGRQTAGGTHGDNDESPARIGPVAITAQQARDGSTTVKLTFDVTVSEPLPDWGLAWGIDSSLGVRLYSVDTFATRADLPRTVGEHTVQIEMPGLGLGGGSYAVNVGIGAVSGHTFDRVANAARFEVGHAGPGRGLIRATPKVIVGHKEVNFE